MPRGSARGTLLYWLEGRPTEGGRNVIVRRHPDGRTEDVIPPPYNARTRVHEYGGADYLVDGDTVYFANFADQRLYVVRLGAIPEPLTAAFDPARSEPGTRSSVRPEPVEGRETPDDASSHPLSAGGEEAGGGVSSSASMPPDSSRGTAITSRRYADFTLDRPRNRLIAVRETHYRPTPAGAHVEPANDIAAIDLSTGDETTLTAGHDFYAYPRLSPDGAHLAWIAWDHPNMPWDATRLYVAALTPDGALDTPRQLAGGPEESVLQPTWSPDGRLHFLSDRTGYWNLYRLDSTANLPLSVGTERGPGGEVAPAMPPDSSGGTAQALCPQPYDFAQPLWQLGTTTYAFDSTEPARPEALEGRESPDAPSSHRLSVGTETGPGREASTTPPDSSAGTPHRPETPNTTPNRPSHPLSASGDGAGGGVAPIIATYCVDGLWRLARIDPTTGALTDIDTPVTAVRDLTVANGRACFIAGFPDRPGALVALDLTTGALETLKPASTLEIDPGYISIAQPIEFPTDPPPGAPAAQYTAHAFYYPPRNKDYERDSSLTLEGEGRGEKAPQTETRSVDVPPLRADGEGAGGEVSGPRGEAAAELRDSARGVARPMPPVSTGGTAAHAEALEAPPLLVMSHGGPTAATAASLSARIQYWTSRGIAVLDVNYGGSTGYGRAYRNRLRHNWGIVDVLDCINGARYLARRGLVDPDRLAITGGSAGGYTTLAALTFHDVFKAGASHYGIGDLEALATDTHKFESRYLDTLVGPYPRDLTTVRPEPGSPEHGRRVEGRETPTETPSTAAEAPDLRAAHPEALEGRAAPQTPEATPDAAALARAQRQPYLDRSPIHHTDRLSTPVIFFQGLEDQIVPPNQAEAMVAALRDKGIPVAYFPFEGEQHGFRRAENIKRALEAELLFYARVFNFTPADDIEPFEIENLPA